VADFWGQHEYCGQVVIVQNELHLVAEAAHHNDQVELVFVVSLPALPLPVAWVVEEGEERAVQESL
jgi:hypothetical protein